MTKMRVMIGAAFLTGGMLSAFATAVAAPLAAAPVPQATKGETLKLSKRFDHPLDPRQMPFAMMGHNQNHILSPDGKLIALSVAVSKQTKKTLMIIEHVKLIDADTGKELATIPGAVACKFSPDSKTLLVNQYSKDAYQKAKVTYPFLPPIVLQMWDVSEPAKPRQRFAIDGVNHNSGPSQSAQPAFSLQTGEFSHDSKLFACSIDPSTKFGNSGKALIGIPKIGTPKNGNAHKKQNTGVNGGGFGGAGFGGGGGMIGGPGMAPAMGPPGFIPSSPQMVEVWEVETAKLVARCQPEKPWLAGTKIAFSPDDTLLACNTYKLGENAQNILLLDMAAKKALRTIECGSYAVQELLFAPKGESMLKQESQIVASLRSAEEAAVKIWNTDGKSAYNLLQVKHDKEKGTARIAMHLAPEGHVLATSVSREMTRRMIIQPAGINGFNPAGGLGGPGGAPMPPAGGAGFGGGGGGGGAGFGGGGAPFPGGGAAPAGGGKRQVAPAPAAGFVGNAGAPGMAGPNFGAPNMMAPPESSPSEVILWNLDNGEKIHTLKDQVRSLAFPRKPLLAIISDKESLKLLDSSTAKELTTLNKWTHVLISEDGHTLVARSADPQKPTLTVWTVELTTESKKE